jgi:hypothetical protein
MPTPSTNSGIRDNHRSGNVADFLKAKLQTGSRLSPRRSIAEKLAMLRELCHHPSPCRH